MRISWQFNATAAGMPYGYRLVFNPTCPMFLSVDGPRCGRDATVRVTRKHCWSILWCPEHAAEFKP